MAKGDFTKAKQIVGETKQNVYQRQHGKSLFSNKKISVGECCCHYVGRGCSGVGYEWNIFGCTEDEHRLYDQSKPIGDMSHEDCVIAVIKHMQDNYNHWDTNKCHYKKYYEEKDYEVTANYKGQEGYVIA